MQTRLVRGRPAKRIVDVAQECGCDLIVMGFHGHGRLHTSLLGCVSQKVMQASPIPVLLIRAPQEAEARVPAATPVEPSLDMRPMTG